MSSDHNIENCFAQVYNVSHRVFLSTQYEQAVIILHLPTANRHKLLTKDVDKRDGGAYYTPLR